MRITIAAVGRLKAGSERELFERYIARAAAAGRRLGLTPSLREFPEGRASAAATRKDQESAAILAALPERAVLVALDERGSSLSSAALAERIAKWRDAGREDLVFAIGGADGHAPQMSNRADLTLSFGEMTWPHQLVRVMLAEQVYRAVTILSGHPYHRE